MQESGYEIFIQTTKGDKIIGPMRAHDGTLW
jgi:hypothetical protein